MNKKLIQRIIKIAQEQTATPKTLPPPPAIPAVTYSYLPKAYNGSTAQAIRNMTVFLNEVMHYASDGRDNMQAMVNNTAQQATSPDQMHINSLARLFYRTFLNMGQDFKGMIQAQTIQGWADNILNSPDYSELSKINPTGPLATKIQGNIKSRILDLMTYIKQVNPIQ